MQIYAQTDIGARRQINQDYIFYSAEPVGVFPNLCILADGMGGHKGGDFASRYLTDTLVGFIRRNRNEDIVKVLKNAVHMANTLIFEKSHSNRELSGMGSTLVAAVIKDGVLTTANVGDSRLYLIRDGIVQITRDHSLVDEMVESGRITKDSEDYRKYKNIITRAVGTEDNVQADYYETVLQYGDYLLICSDGLTNMVDDDDIFSIISGHGSLRYKTQRLIDVANENGGNDNIAVILIRYDGESAENA